MDPHIIKVSILVLVTIFVTWLVSLSPYNAGFLLHHVFDWQVNTATQSLTVLVFGFMVFDIFVLVAELPHR